MGRFSYNVAEGRCPECSGTGQIEVELVFLPGSYATCPLCHGRRYADETLEGRWEGLTIAEVLDLSVTRAREVFAGDPRIIRALDALAAIGLGYLALGQSATELSGGEAQRIKLATELQRTVRGHSIYLLDEPTSGLHPADVDLLVSELNRLVDAGQSVVVVEHDQRVIAQADHVIDMGPGAGGQGRSDHRPGRPGGDPRGRRQRHRRGAAKGRSARSGLTPHPAPRTPRGNPTSVIRGVDAARHLSHPSDGLVSTIRVDVYWRLR